MTNAERIQANNAELREAIGLAESLPDAESDTMVGTWILNEVLDLHNFNFFVNFVLPNVADSLPFYNIYSDASLGDSLHYVDENEDMYTPYENGAWVLPDWRTTNITEEPNDAECKAWIKANGRKATYEDGIAEGEKAILSTYVDWSVSSASNYCFVEFYNNSDYYAHMYCYIGNPASGQNYETYFVIPPQDMYYIDSEEEMDAATPSGEWLVNASIRGFSKDGEK
jgi:hypothetical protein